MTAATKNLIITVALLMACGVFAAIGINKAISMNLPLWLKIVTSGIIFSMNCSSAYLISKYQIQAFRDQPPQEMPMAGLPGSNSPYGHSDYAGNERYRFNLNSPVESQAARGERLWFWNHQTQTWRPATEEESLRIIAPTPLTVEVTTTESIAQPVGFSVTPEEHRAQREEEIRQIRNLAPGEWFTISQPWVGRGLYSQANQPAAEAAAKKSIPSGRRAIRGGDA